MKKSSKIPIKNIWWLMLYASEFSRMRDDSARRFGVDDSLDDIPDLIAKILTRAVMRRLLRNLSVELHRRHADLSRVRGRIDHIRTKRHLLLEQGRIACSFDYFTTNTARNQYVKTALDRLSRIVKDEELKRTCRAYAAALERAGVTRDWSYTTMLRTNRAPGALARSNPEDRRMLAAAELALNMSIPTEESGTYVLPVIDKDDGWLRKLFEKAVGGFYEVTLPHPEWSVRQGRRIFWQQESPTNGIKEILPNMQTDITLERKDIKTHTKSRVIVDTKFTSMMTDNQYGKPRLKRDHIFQIYAYLMSQEHQDDPPSRTASGILLYPSLGADMDESVTIQGHIIRFVTVDLASDGESIRKRLLDLV